MACVLNKNVKESQTKLILILPGSTQTAVHLQYGYRVMPPEKRGVASMNELLCNLTTPHFVSTNNFGTKKHHSDFAPIKVTVEMDSSTSEMVSLKMPQMLKKLKEYDEDIDSTSILFMLDSNFDRESE